MAFPFYWLAPAVFNIAESIVDSCRDSVSPAIGSIVYCDLAFGYMEHSGVYIGNNKIVHLNSDGEIEAVSPSQFVEGTTAINIYVSCYDDEAIGCELVADKAIAMLGNSVNYNFILNNCHQFTAGCLTGNFEGNDCSFLCSLKSEAEQQLFANTWRHWDIDL